MAKSTEDVPVVMAFEEVSTRALAQRTSEETVAQEIIMVKLLIVSLQTQWL